MLRSRLRPPEVILLCAATAIQIGCGPRTPASSTETRPAPASAPALALAGLAGQRIIVLPTNTIRIAPELNWTAAIGHARDVQQAFDAEIAAALKERGTAQGWIFPEALQQAYRRNASYAADPYALAEDLLRSPKLAVGTRLTEPFASQIRTMVALHEDARLVLAPVELRFEQAQTASAAFGRAVLRLVLVDARASDVRWIGEVASDSAATYGPALLADVASRVGDLVAKR